MHRNLPCYIFNSLNPKLNILFRDGMLKFGVWTLTTHRPLESSKWILRNVKFFNGLGVNCFGKTFKTFVYCPICITLIRK